MRSVPSQRTFHGWLAMSHNPYLADTSTFDDPNCLMCLRTKLDAIGVVVFFRNSDRSWRLGGFQGEKPSEAAEAECLQMLRTGMPEKVWAAGKTFVLGSARDIALAFPKVAAPFVGPFGGSCLIAGPIQHDELVGVRLAWRDESRPFTTEDEATVRCWGNCPETCCNHCAVGGG